MKFPTFIYFCAIFHSIVAQGIMNPIWPSPSSFKSGTIVAKLDKKFKIQTNSSSERLLRIVDRYQTLIANEKWVTIVPYYKAEIDQSSNSNVTVNIINLMVSEGNESLDDTTDESYSLSIGQDGETSISSKTIYGSLRGLESFSQMVQKVREDLIIPGLPLEVKDQPKYAHRGVLIDSSRNFLPISDIKRTLTAMSYSKLNVLHWHLIDSNSFTFRSKMHPELWQLGAIDKNMTYTSDDIKDLIDYGLDRGVRIIPEMEAPAHAYAIGKAFPELAACPNQLPWNDVAAEPPSGQLDPTNPKSLALVKDIITELASLFPDSYFHLSGDEVNEKCWTENEKISKFMKENNVDVNGLLSNFSKGMQDQAKDLGKKIMVWEEILLKHNATLPDSALVQVWLGSESVKNVTSKGHKVIISSSDYFYLDCGRGDFVGASPQFKSWCDPYKSWQRIYSYDFTANLTSTQSNLISGGEVAAWGELVDSTNLDNVLWPRAAVAGELLWFGNKDADGKMIDNEVVLPRLNNFRFRLVHRGVRAEPIQPYFCVVNPGQCPRPKPISNARFTMPTQHITLFILFLLYSLF